MSIEIIEINGKHPKLNYEKFESTLHECISGRCSDAKVFLLNNFPVSVSVETSIDLIIIIAIDPRKDNFYGLRKGDKLVYLNNLILPVKFVNDYASDTLEFEGNQIISGDAFVDYSNEINSIKFGLINYLSNKCNFIREELYIHPIVFIQNPAEKIVDNHIVAESFDFKAISKYLLHSSLNIFISYKRWRTEIGYASIASSIEAIAEQASKDSELGYLTKRKIQRIAEQLSDSKKIYEELNQHLIIVTGKAGTGKSSELLLLAMRCISNGKKTMFLTYNKLLIFDISKTVKSYINSASIASREKVGEGSVLTLHQFFYRLSLTLGVLHVLSDERIEKLLATLKQRMRLVYDFFAAHINYAETIVFEQLKTTIQNSTTFDIATKEVGIGFINFASKRALSSPKDLAKSSKEFYEHKKAMIGLIEANNVFLADYYGVLENTFLAIQDPAKYFEKHNIQDKFELLDIILKLQDKHIDNTNEGKKIRADGFREQKNRKVGGFKRKRTLFIDEAQDCDRREKDILVEIYTSNNMVIASGGKEQLIRHVELCNWEVSQAKKLQPKKYPTRNKSYRLKKTIVDFCNFFAKKFQIDLNLEPLASEDEGELIIDFRRNQPESEIVEVFNHLTLKSEVNGCTPYEGLLVLLESNSQRGGAGREHIQESAIINEYGNIEDAHVIRRGTWRYLKSLEDNKYMFWDGTVSDKSHLIVPSPNESRIIYYESCRGLEAWTVACFAIDKFFNQKTEDPDAEQYLIEDLFLNQDNEQRKKMYAATWVLMALTRVIDTLYLQINDPDSFLGKVVMEYVAQKPKNVRVLNAATVTT